MPIDYDNNKSYCFALLNNDKEPTKFLTFKENDEIFFLSKETKKSNIEKVLMLGTIMEEGYKLVNDIDIKSILKYTGELLHSDWVRYYVRKNDKIFTEKEQWQNPNSHMYGIQDTKDVSLLMFNYTQPYFFIRKHHLISNERKEIWKKFNINKKLIIPIWYDEKLQRQISFAYSKGQEPNNALIHVVIEITNIIFQLKNQFEREHIKQIQMEQIRQSLFQYAKNEKDRLDRKIKLDEYSLKEQEELIQALKEKI